MPFPPNLETTLMYTETSYAKFFLKAEKEQNNLI